MKQSEWLTRDEAMRELKLNNRNVLTWLVKRELLQRVWVGPRSPRYIKESVLKLKQMVVEQGISLNERPKKAA